MDDRLEAGNKSRDRGMKTNLLYRLDPDMKKQMDRERAGAGHEPRKERTVALQTARLICQWSGRAVQGSLKFDFEVCIETADGVARSLIGEHLQYCEHLGFTSTIQEDGVPLRQARKIPHLLLHPVSIRHMMRQ